MVGPIVLKENLRALFYAPYYVAHEHNLFASEGVDVQLETSDDPVDTARQLLAGEVDVCWGGPLRVLRLLDDGDAAGLRCFGEVVGRDPFILVGRAPADGFTLNSLRSMRLGVVSEVPTPWICLQQDLRDSGIDPSVLDIVHGPSMEENARALADGELDAYQSFQPHAEQSLEDSTVTVLYAAATRGPTAYTCFYSTDERIESNRESFAAMVRAMRSAVAMVYNRDGVSTAMDIAPFFPDVPTELAAASIDRYRSLSLYNRSGDLPEAGFDCLRRAMITAGFIRAGASYDDCVEVSPSY